MTMDEPGGDRAGGLKTWRQSKAGLRWPVTLRRAVAAADRQVLPDRVRATNVHPEPFDVCLLAARWDAALPRLLCRAQLDALAADPGPSTWPRGLHRRSPPTLRQAAVRRRHDLRRRRKANSRPAGSYADRQLCEADRDSRASPTSRRSSEPWAERCSARKARPAGRAGLAALERVRRARVPGRAGRKQLDEPTARRALATLPELIRRADHATRGVRMQAGRRGRSGGEQQPSAGSAEERKFGQLRALRIVCGKPAHPRAHRSRRAGCRSQRERRRPWTRCGTTYCAKPAPRPWSEIPARWSRWWPGGLPDVE